MPFFTFGIVGFGIGLIVTFAGNLLMNKPQPALLYLIPSLSIFILIAAFI